jgi:cytochrome c553
MNHTTLLLLALSLTSAPAAWAAGDAAAGKKTYDSSGCSGCHGAEGHSANPNNPSLAGKDPAALKLAMMDFKSGKRANPLMQSFCQSLSEADMDNLSAYLGALK